MTAATEDGHKLFAVCVDRETGKIIHDVHVFDVEQPQPIAAENFFNENAVCTVIRPGRNFEGLAVNRLNEQPLMASPAVAGDSFFIRTEKHLYRVEEITP
jgi:hypothetical protein